MYNFHYVKDQAGRFTCYENAVSAMDNDLREELHNKLAPCTNQEFFDAYGKAHEERFGEGWLPYVGEYLDGTTWFYTGISEDQGEFDEDGEWHMA